MISSGDKTSSEDISHISIVMRLLIIAMFVLPLMLMIVVGIMRIFFIWLYLIFAPFLVIDWIFNGPMSKKPQFSFSSAIGLIFQPVGIVIGLSLTLLVALWMNSLISGVAASNISSSADKLISLL